jgi:hypothetical protein
VTYGVRAAEPGAKLRAATPLWIVGGWVAEAYNVGGQEVRRGALRLSRK